MLSLFAKGQKNTLLDMSFWDTHPDIETVRKEIAAGNDPSARNRRSDDVVVSAIRSKQDTEIIKFLIEQDGNSVNKKTRHSKTYLHWASATNNVDLVKYLIAKGADPNATDSRGFTVLQTSASEGKNNIEIFDTLIKAGANPKLKTNKGTTVMMMALGQGADLKVVDYFISKGLSIKDKDALGRTTADYAAKLGNLTVIGQLAKKGVKPTDQALFFATIGLWNKQNGVNVYKNLIEKYKLNPKAIDATGRTLLHHLYISTDADLINYLVNQGVDVNKTDKAGNTVLMLFASHRNLDILKKIISKTKNINATNNHGESALMLAVLSGTADGVKLLLENGADYKITDKEGNNLAYYWFRSYRPSQNGIDENFEKKLNLIESTGLDITAPQKNGNTLLHLAADFPEIELVEKALKLGVDVNAINEDGNTGLHLFALVSQNDQILRTLVEAGARKEIQTVFGETAYDLAKDNNYLTEKNISVEFLK